MVIEYAVSERLSIDKLTQIVEVMSLKNIVEHLQRQHKIFVQNAESRFRKSNFWMGCAIMTLNERGEHHEISGN